VYSSILNTERAESLAAGGLLSYGPSVPDTYRQLGIYTASAPPHPSGEEAAGVPMMEPASCALPR
jgi:hypothetical protein